MENECLSEKWLIMAAKLLYPSLSASEAQLGEIVE